MAVHYSSAGYAAVKDAKWIKKRVRLYNTPKSPSIGIRYPAVDPWDALPA